VQPALELRAVDKRYPNGVRSLHGVDLTVPGGETLVLVGESGSGKSTLLRLFNRLEEPTSGEVRIDGRPARDHDPVRLRRRTGYVQQDGGLLPHWDVGRNVELVPSLLDWPAAARRERADAALELVGLAPGTFRYRYPSQLSGGERQRVAVARALCADPPVVLLDEPFGALDAITRLEIQAEFLRLRRELGKTMVLVTHDLAEAIRLGDRIAVLRAGRIVQVDEPAALRAHPADEYVARLLALAGGAA
jgi:osmoprotectant transport system ATP-binding protein